MAAAGFEGCEDVVGEPEGILDAWGAEGDRDAVTRGLGEDYAIMGANFKFVRAGYPIHTVVEAALAIVAEHEVPATAITAVHVGMPSNAMRVVDNRDMHNICVQDMLSVALLRGGLSLQQEYFPEILSDPGFAPMRARISVGGDPDLDRELPNGRGANVTITTVRGQKYSKRVDWPRGHSQRGGVSWSDLSQKWHDGLPRYDIDRVIALGQRLEELDDVSELVREFRSPE